MANDVTTIRYMDYKKNFWRDGHLVFFHMENVACLTTPMCAAVYAALVLVSQMVVVEQSGW